MCFVPSQGKYRHSSQSHSSFSKILIENEYFMTINIFVLKGDLNGENRSGVFLFLLGILPFYSGKNE